MRIPEYDLHSNGARVDDALTELDHLITRARARRPAMFAVVTGYGSSGGTSLIKAAVLRACARYLRQNHIRGYLDGEKAADFFCPESLAYPDLAKVPYPNPGVVFISV